MLQPAEIIKEVIAALNLDAAKFSREIGNSRPDPIYKILDGKTSPTWATMQKIATRFPELSAEFLLRGAGPVLQNAQLLEHLKGEVEFLRGLVAKV